MFDILNDIQTNINKLYGVITVHEIEEDFMGRFIKRRLELIIALCIVLSICSAIFIHNAVKAEPQDFYFYYINSANNSEKVKITEYAIEKSNMVIHLNSDSGLYDNDQITWHVEDPSILTIEQTPGSRTSATLKALKPGTSKVWAEIKRPKGETFEIFSAECIFTVVLAINDYTNVPENQGKIIHLFEEDNKDCGSLVLDVGENFNLGLKIGQAQAQDLSWTSLNKNIAQIDSSGKVVGIQPGIAKILAQTYDLEHQNTILQSDYIYVVIKPKFKDANGVPKADINLSNPTTLQTNISDYNGSGSSPSDDEIEPRNAAEFAWIVRDASDNTILVDTLSNLTSPRVTITPSRVDGSAKINCKSGNYIVEVYPLYEGDSDVNVIGTEYAPSKAIITEYVKVNTLSMLDYVQVNDVWDLYKVSNIYNVAKDFDITVDNCDYNREKGIITFNNQGIAMIQFQKKSDSQLPLDEDLFENGILTVFVKVRPYTIPDKTVRIMKGATERISISDYGYEPSDYGTVYQYEFRSNDTSIATVYSNTPRTTDITGVKDGATTVDCLITYDNGIIRKITCNVIVWKKISAKLSVTEKEIMVDEQFTISASYSADANPESDINVKWVDVTNDVTKSPIQIINNDDTNYKSVSILGVRKGQTTIALMDLNDKSDAKPLAVCVITVVEKTTVEFEKSDYDVVLDKNNLNVNKLNLELIYKPKAPTNPRVEWDSTNKTVATVENGLVTYKSAGYSYITAKYYLTDNSFVSASCRVNVYQQYEKVTLSKTSVKVNTGDEINIKAICSPSDYIWPKDKVLTWKTNNDIVVQVSGNDEIPTMKAVGPGRAIITVSTTSGKTATCTIEVSQPPTGISFPDKSITMKVGEKKALITTLVPLNVTDKTLTFSSSNDDYLTIDDKGYATAVSAGIYGKVNVDVRVATSNGLQATLRVTIIQHVTDMQLNYSEKKIAKGTTFALKPIITPNNAYNKGVTYHSANTRVATVTSSGVVRGVNGGYALISCTSNDTGLTRYCLLVVEEKTSSISLNKSTYVIGINKTYTLKATVKSNYSTNSKVKWKSSNSKIVTVTQKGEIKGIKPGYATITVTAQDGSGVYATCRVRVIRQVTTINLNKASAQIIKGDSLKLIATVKPTNATLKSVKWTSSDEKVAYVDSVGKVVAVDIGRCIITATTKDGSGKSAKCIVEVINENPITSLTIVNRDITMIVGENTKLNSYVAPKRNTDKLRWYSDDTRIVSINSKTGKMKALRTGTATITLASSSGKATTTTVTVVGLSRTSLTMEQYDTYQLRVINGRSIQWDSVNQHIVNVSRTGKLSARKKGTTYVTAIVNGRKIRCKVTVKSIK